MCIAEITGLAPFPVGEIPSEVIGGVELIGSKYGIMIHVWRQKLLQSIDYVRILLQTVGDMELYEVMKEDTILGPFTIDEIGEFVDGVAPATFYGVDGQINENGKGFDIEKILSSFNNKENIEKLKEQYDKELGEWRP